MKQLICVTDIQQLAERQQFTCVVESTALITPAAWDAAEEYGIAIVKKEPAPAASELSMELLSSLKYLCNQPELLEQLMKTLRCTPFDCQTDAFGTRLIRGSSIQFIKNSDGISASQQLFSSLFHCLSVERVDIEASETDVTFAEEELQLILAGEIKLKIKGTLFTAGAGDILICPKDVLIRRTVDCHAKLVCIRLNKE